MKVAAQGLERIYTQAREEGILFFRFHQEKLNIMQTGEDLRLESWMKYWEPFGPST